MSRPLDRWFGPEAQKKKATHLPVAAPMGRLRILLIAVAVLFSLAAGRAVQVQAIDASNVAEEAADQITVAHVLPAFRGEISDRNGEVLAMTADTVKIVADAKMIRTNGRMDAEMTTKDREVAAAAPQQIADLLVRYLGGLSSDYLPKLTASGKGESYQVVANRVASATYRELAQAMNDADLVGLRSESNPTRVYPNGTLASNVIGFLKEDGTGASGLEQSLNKSLAGTAGKESYETSPNGKIPLGNSVITPAINGLNYQLTLDAGMQWQLDQIVADRVRKTKADSGMAVVMNVKTGEILALSNYPTFDANDPSTANEDDLYNRALTNSYTPGSVQKTLTFAAMLDQGLVKATDVVTIPSKIKSGDHYITDAWSHGTLKYYARGIIAKSSNIGTIVLARKLSKQTLHDYLVSFGLGAKTGVGLPGESAGSLPGADMPDYTRDGVVFGGSGVAVTLLQEASAVAAVTNGGVYHSPWIVKSRTNADGSVTEYSGGTPRRVISAEASAELVSMMETMVTQSTSHTFDVAGYRTGAKTGTSKKFDKDCNCFRGLVTSTIGVGPVEDPQILTYVVVDNPRRGSSGSAVAGPAYQDAMSIALARYGVTPSKTASPKLPIEP